MKGWREEAANGSFYDTERGRDEGGRTRERERESNSPTGSNCKRLIQRELFQSTGQVFHSFINMTRHLLRRMEISPVAF